MSLLRRAAVFVAAVAVVGCGPSSPAAQAPPAPTPSIAPPQVVAEPAWEAWEAVTEGRSSVAVELPLGALCDQDLPLPAVEPWYLPRMWPAHRAARKGANVAKQFIELLARKRFADAAKWVDSDHPVCFFDDFEVCLTRTELEGCRSASERKVWQPDDPARTCEEGMGALIPPGWEQQATSNVNCPRHDITHSAMTLDPPPILVAIWRLDDRLREVRWVGLEERDGKVTVVAVWAARTWL